MNRSRHGAPFHAQELRFWMSTPVVTVTPATPLSEALALMHEHSIRRLPVLLETGEVCGIITDGDIRGANVLSISAVDVTTSLHQIKVNDVMSESPITVRPVTTLREAALLMLDNKIGGLPVVDQTSCLIGIVTESDLFEALVCYLDRGASDA